MNRTKPLDGFEFRPSLFWDVDASTIDPQKNANYVIERILDFGHDSEVKWMWHFYSKEQIKHIVETSRSLQPSTRSLWNLLLE